MAAALPAAQCTAAWRGGTRLTQLRLAPPPRRRCQHPHCALPPDLADALSSSAGPAAAMQPQLLGLEALAVAAAAYVAALWPDRPRGWARGELLRVAPSQVAGLGVFAAQPIAAGTVLGGYPGRPRSPAGMAAKAAAAPAARDFCFRTRGDMLLDPTDASGRLSPAPAPGLPWLPVAVTLAYINEPPRGVGGTNVSVEDDPGDPNGLLCVAARDIAAGEELFMDYGVTYDRSGYGAPEQQQQQQEPPGASGGAAGQPER